MWCDPRDSNPHRFDYESNAFTIYAKVASLILGASDRTRTGKLSRRILSPLGLPISPLRHTYSKRRSISEHSRRRWHTILTQNLSQLPDHRASMNPLGPYKDRRPSFTIRIANGALCLNRTDSEFPRRLTRALQYHYANRAIFIYEQKSSIVFMFGINYTDRFVNLDAGPRFALGMLLAYETGVFLHYPQYLLLFLVL